MAFGEKLSELLEGRGITQKEFALTLKNEKHISLDEAADYLGIRPVTLCNWFGGSEKEVPEHKVERF